MHLTLKNSQGLTLVDLLVTVSVLAVLGMLAAPAFSGLIAEQRRLTFANELASGLRSARLAAIDHNRGVILQPLDTNWANGWRMVLDNSGKGLSDPHNPVLLVRTRSGKVPVVPTLNLREQVGFDSLGVPRLANRGAVAGTFHLCEGAGNSHRRVVIARSGRIRVTREGAASGLCPVN